VVVLLDDELPVFELFPLLVGAAEFEPPLFAFELLALPLFELLAPFPAVVDELLSVGVVVLEPPLLEPLLDGELLVFSLLDAGEAESPLPGVD
jgi:hypothetical protein